MILVSCSSSLICCKMRTWRTYRNHCFKHLPFGDLQDLESRQLRTEFLKNSLSVVILYWLKKDLLYPSGTRHLGCKLIIHFENWSLTCVFAGGGCQFTSKRTWVWKSSSAGMSFAHPLWICWNAWTSAWGRPQSSIAKVILDWSVKGRYYHWLPQPQWNLTKPSAECLMLRCYI